MFSLWLQPCARFIESFEGGTSAANSLEQLLINLTNEKLQGFFSHEYISSQQQAYVDDGISWDTVTFVDNTETIALLESRGVSVLSLLDDACMQPGGTDQTLAAALQHHLAVPPSPASDRTEAGLAFTALDPSIFTARHYAGPVTYSVDGFLAKNRDSISDAQEGLLGGAATELVSAVAGLVGSRRGLLNVTVAGQFRAALGRMMAKLAETSPHYIKCIAPNKDRTAGSLDTAFVAAQLRASGVMETVRVTTSGYGYRATHGAFAARFRVLASTAVRSLGHATTGANQDNNSSNMLGTVPPISDAEVCINVLDRIGLAAPGDYQLGATQVFVRCAAAAQLEEARASVFETTALVCQKNARAARTRRAFLNLKRHATTAQSVVRRFLANKQVRTMRARAAASVVIQKAVRTWLPRLRNRRAVIIQSLVRGRAVRRKLGRLRLERVGALAGAAAAAKARIVDLEAEAGETNDLLASLVAKLDHRNAEVDILAANSAATGARLHDAEAAIEILTNEANMRELALDQARADSRRLAAALDAADQAVRRGRRTAEETAADLRQRQTALVALQQDLSGARLEIRLLKTQLATANTENSSLRAFAKRVGASRLWRVVSYVETSWSAWLRNGLRLLRLMEGSDSRFLRRLARAVSAVGMSLARHGTRGLGLLLGLVRFGLRLVQRFPVIGFLFILNLGGFFAEPTAQRMIASADVATAAFGGGRASARGVCSPTPAGIATMMLGGSPAVATAAAIMSPTRAGSVSLARLGSASPKAGRSLIDGIAGTVVDHLL